MSECRHDFDFNKGKYCLKCGISVIEAWNDDLREKEKIEKENADLRAKLAILDDYEDLKAANKTLNERVVELEADDKKQMEEIRELRGLRNILTARAEQAEDQRNQWEAECSIAMDKVAEITELNRHLLAGHNVTMMQSEINNLQAANAVLVEAVKSALHDQLWEHNVLRDETVIQLQKAMSIAKCRGEIKEG